VRRQISWGVRASVLGGTRRARSRTTPRGEPPMRRKSRSGRMLALMVLGGLFALGVPAGADEPRPMTPGNVPARAVPGKVDPGKNSPPAASRKRTRAGRTTAAKPPARSASEREQARRANSRAQRQAYEDSLGARGFSNGSPFAQQGQSFGNSDD